MTVRHVPKLFASAFALLGLVIGYRSAGIGGAVLYAAFFGITGAIAGAVVMRSAILGRAAWPYLLLIAALVALIVIGWGVYL